MAAAHARTRAAIKALAADVAREREALELAVREAERAETKVNSLSIHPSTNLSIYLSGYLSIHLSIYLSFYLSI